MSVEYKFNHGTRSVPAGFYGAATEVADRLEALRQKAGRLTPDVVLDDAADPQSLLHPFFEWDNTVAAREYRLCQARALIRAVVVVYRSQDDTEKTVSAYVSIAEGDGSRHYISVPSSIENATKRQDILRAAWNDLAKFRRKYADLIEFASLFASIDEIKPTISEENAA